MGELALELIRTNLDNAHLNLFGQRLADWLIIDLNQSSEPVPDFTESRAKALLRATGFADDPTLHDFSRLMETDTAVRVALYDLLHGTGLAEASEPEVQALAATSNAAAVDPSVTIPWLALAIAAQAWKSEFPLYQLDPATPPGEHSPAGQLVRRAATFLRQQVQRTATEREKLGRKLAFAPGTAVSSSPSLEELNSQQEIAPVPPHFRPPIPVNYPEYARETIAIEPDEPDIEPPVTRNPPITITESDVAPPAEPPEQRPVTMPPIQITEDQLPRTPSRRQQARPSSRRSSSTNFNTAVQRRFGSKEPMKAVKLRIVVQEYQDGPGMYGLQVKVSCQGIKAFVAGTTNREGLFLCELPVLVRSGLTYDVDITWPRDMGSETERKSITLNTDRTEFTLPFYHRLAG